MVVVSILIAFWLDAWWGDRELAVNHREAMAAVQAELEENRRLLDDQIFILDRITGAGAEVLDAMYAEPGAQSVQLPDSLAWLVASWAPSLEVSHGAVDALIPSGQLARIRSPDLRLGLAALRDRFANVIEDEIIARQIHVEQQMPLLASMGEFDRFSPMDAAFFHDDDYTRRAAPHTGMMDFPNSRVLRNTIREKSSWYGSALGEMRALIVHLEALLALLGDE